jgi:hypothetical protein
MRHTTSKGFLMDYDDLDGTVDYFLHGLHNQSGKWMRLIKINSKPLEPGSVDDELNKFIELAANAFKEGLDGQFSGNNFGDPITVNIQHFSAFTIKTELHDL